MTQDGNCSTAKAGIEPKSASVEVDALPLGQRGGKREREREREREGGREGEREREERERERAPARLRPN